MVLLMTEYNCQIFLSCPAVHILLISSILWIFLKVLNFLSFKLISAQATCTPIFMVTIIEFSFFLREENSHSWKGSLINEMIYKCWRASQVWRNYLEIVAYKKIEFYKRFRLCDKQSCKAGKVFGQRVYIKVISYFHKILITYFVAFFPFSWSNHFTRLW